MPPLVGYYPCQNCREWVRTDAASCLVCGAAVDPDPNFEYVDPTPPPAPAELPEAVGMAQDRGVWAQLAGTVGLGPLLPAAAFYSAATARPAPGREMWMLAIAAYAVGLLVCGGGTVLAFLDLKGMAAGRVNSNGRLKVLLGGVVSACSLLVYWVAAGFGIARLF